MERYEFNLTITGEGLDVDAAFQNAIDSLCENPHIALQQEVVYVVLSNDPEPTEPKIDN